MRVSQKTARGGRTFCLLAELLNVRPEVMLCEPQRNLSASFNTPALRAAADSSLSVWDL